LITGNFISAGIARVHGQCLSAEEEVQKINE
jgi:hypothetical protein